MEKNILNLVVAIILLSVGFFLGRKTIEAENKTEYVKVETVHDTIVIPQPTFVEVPAKPEYIYKYDTIVVNDIQYISEKVDTSAIIKDYILTRTYEFSVFNSPTLGKFDVKQQIGYNKLLSFDYTFTPITKQITRIEEPMFTPFVTGGYSTNKSLIMGGGIYIKNLGVEYNYNINLNKTYYNDIDISQSNYHTFKLNYKL